MPTTGRGGIGNLPAEMSSFVGRGREVREVSHLVPRSRLVTLTGMGGTGKTRLAVRVANGLRRTFPDGVWLADLTELHNSEQLPQQVQDPDVLAFLLMGTLGLREQDGGPPLQSLVAQLADRQLLLVLDNCEHLLPACAIVAEDLLHGCPGLRVIATSREALAVAGETLFPVPPLPAPDPGGRLDLAEIGRCEAVELFVARARAAILGFDLTEDNHAAVAELCHRLDGLPLAIELAASRVRALTPQQILDRLADRFALLNRGSRTSPTRQQTLRACLDWSFDLCSKPERMLWARLSVFAGTFDLPAVEGVCADEHLPEANVLDLITGLVDKSILIRDGGADNAGDDPQDGPVGIVRYRMLETIREYGQHQLCEAEEESALRRRHRDWYQELLTRARDEWISDRQAYWMTLLPRERANLRAAVEFCLTEPGEVEAGLRLAVTLPGLYWRANGLFGEGRRWLDRALAEVTAPTAVRARALLVNSRLAFSQGDTEAAMRLLDEGEDLAQRLAAGPELAYAALIRGMGALYADDASAAVGILGPAWQALSTAPDPDPLLCVNILSILSMAAGLAGHHESAIVYQQELLAIVERHGEGLHRSVALWAGGLIAWRRRDLHQATAQVKEALRSKRAWASHDPYGTAQCVEVLAWITADLGRHRRAAELLGAAEALWCDVGTAITAYRHLAGYHGACEQQLRTALGEAAFTEATVSGRTLAYEDLLAYALEEPRQPEPAARKAPPTPLTPRERQIAGLIAQGLTNKEIARALVISRRTAESHVERILTKLSFTSRTQVAAWVTELGGVPAPSSSPPQ
jgi:predicted ATPase/DNA-binding CsgD family transcriptional regulator